MQPAHETGEGIAAAGAISGLGGVLDVGLAAAVGDLDRHWARAGALELDAPRRFVTAGWQGQLSQVGAGRAIAGQQRRGEHVVRAHVWRRKRCHEAGTIGATRLCAHGRRWLPGRGQGMHGLGEGDPGAAERQHGQGYADPEAGHVVQVAEHRGRAAPAQALNDRCEGAARPPDEEAGEAGDQHGHAQPADQAPPVLGQHHIAVDIVDDAA